VIFLFTARRESGRFESCPKRDPWRTAQTVADKSVGAAQSPLLDHQEFAVVVAKDEALVTAGYLLRNEAVLSVKFNPGADDLQLIAGAKPSFCPCRTREGPRWVWSVSSAVFSVR